MLLEKGKVLFNVFTNKVSISYPPPPQVFRGSRKNGPFFTFLKFFHFYQKVKENKKFFVKKNAKKYTKNCNFQFLEKVFHFQIFHFLHHISTRENEKTISKKSQKNFKKITKKQNFSKCYEKLKKKTKNLTFWSFF